jgi:hypothetical protein
MVPENNSVNEEKYLGNRSNDKSIYNTSQGSFVYPMIAFGGKHQNIARFCLIDFKGDTIYKCLELQEIMQENGMQYVILAYRYDKEIDIYYTKGFSGSEDDYKSLLNKVTMKELDSIQVSFKVMDNGADINVTFRDKENRTVEFGIKENKKEDDHFSLIAPIGNVSEEPDKFPIVFLKKVVMVRQEGTEIFVRINGQDMMPIKLVPLCNFKKCYLARYTYSVITKELNCDYKGELKPVEINDNKEEVHINNNTYLINMNNGHPEIRSVEATENSSAMRINFSPPIPDIASLKDDTNINGYFSLSVDEVKGIMGGIYNVKKIGDSINIGMNPKKGWQPIPGKLWLKTYSWSCQIDNINDVYHMKSKWMRI